MLLIPSLDAALLDKSIQIDSLRATACGTVMWRFLRKIGLIQWIRLAMIAILSICVLLFASCSGHESPGSDLPAMITNRVSRMAAAEFLRLEARERRVDETDWAKE